MIQQHYSLAAHHALGFESVAQYACVVDSVTAVQEAVGFAKSKQLELMVLGAGSNVLLRPHIAGLVVLNKIYGIKLLEQTEETVLVEVGAGEVLDQFIQYALSQQWYGLENLSWIPGLVGAAPIQNVGAYGVETQDFCESVLAFHVPSERLSTLSRQDCQFAYRESLFKQAGTDEYIILAVRFRLLRQAQLRTQYQSIQVALQTFSGNLNADALRRIIIQIRQQKLPDVRTLPNVGSFFLNPLISQLQWQELSHQYPNLPRLGGASDLCKVPAGWLIEQCGYKGYKNLQTGVGVFEQNALVLVRFGPACLDDLLALATEIKQAVWKKFAIALAIEPRMY
jgi:UDP-N-acetylmuramate dehydrogenase